MTISINSGRSTNLTASRDINIFEATNSGEPLSPQQIEDIEHLISEINDAVKKKEKSTIQTALDVLVKISSTVATSVVTRLINNGFSHLLK